MIFDEIEENSAALQDIAKQTQMLITPHPADPKRLNAHEKKLDRLASQHKERCFGIERHVDLLIKTLLLQNGGDREKVANLVEHTHKATPMDPWLAAQMAERQDQSTAKKEVSGQRHIQDELADNQMSKV